MNEQQSSVEPPSNIPYGQEIPSFLVLKVTLLSDATFSSGHGLAAQVDVEIDHDRHGLPQIGGRVLKGLLVEECANILCSLQLQGTAAPDMRAYNDAARFLFGGPGSVVGTEGALEVKSARTPADLRAAVANGIQAGNLQAEQILEAFTAVRRRTAIDVSGVPQTGSLRSIRVLRHRIEPERLAKNYLTLSATLFFKDTAIPDRFSCSKADVMALLAASVLAVRRGGLSRNRGTGRLKCDLAWPEDTATAPSRANAGIAKALCGAFPMRAQRQK